MPSAITQPTGVLEFDRRPFTAYVNYGVVKAALVLAFAVAIVASPAVVEGEAMGFRAPLFLAPAVVIPILARFRGWDPIPTRLTPWSPYRS
jgi:hypothetical protein